MNFIKPNVPLVPTETTLVEMGVRDMVHIERVARISQPR